MSITVITNRKSYFKIRTVVCLLISFVAIPIPSIADRTTAYSWSQTTSELPFVYRQKCPRVSFDNDSTIQMYWEETDLFQEAITNKPCLQPNGLPLRRKCIVDQYQNVVWAPASAGYKECITRTREKLLTNTLIDLEAEAFETHKIQPSMAIRRLKRTLRAGDFQLIPTDVFLISRITRKAVDVSESQDLCLELLSIINWLTGTDRNVLRASAVLDSTNSLLRSFESCIDSKFTLSNDTAETSDQIDTLDLKNMGIRAHMAENLSVFYIDPTIADVSGIALYNQTNKPRSAKTFHERFGDFYYRFLFFNETIDGLLKENGLEMASFIPLDLWNSFESSSRDLIIKVYSSDALFMESRLNTSRKVFSKIASLTVPGVQGYFTRLLPMIFRSHSMEAKQKHPATGCGYWNYNTWVSDGLELIHDNLDQNSLIACGSHHMTQFAYLIGGDYRYNDLSDSIVITKVHMRALNIITLVGCTLSMLGIFGIFITSIVFKTWRSKPSSKVLLHLSAAIALQMILFCFVNTHGTTVDLLEDRNYGGCVAVGALLQYSILVQFTWMLIIAFLQFQRYVQVFGSRTNHLILKAAILGWGAPVIPPAILIVVNPASYVPKHAKGPAICYPSGHGLNFGVILPIALIIVANLFIFVMVVWSIRNTLEISSKISESRKISQQIRLMVMMFFLFGFSWIFGLLAAVDAGLAFSYLFCISATLQGFVLFVYFVLLDPETRKLWYQICCDAEAEVKSTETTGLRTTSSNNR